MKSTSPRLYLHALPYHRLSGSQLLLLLVSNITESVLEEVHLKDRNAKKCTLLGVLVALNTGVGVISACSLLVVMCAV